jgi:hypothetical protein
MPKYAVTIHDTITRSCTVNVEAPSAREARIYVEALSEASGAESDAILDLLSLGLEDVETTFECTEEDQLLDEAALTNFNSDSD